MSESSEKAEFMRAAEAMYEELRTWREANPDATFDEIAAQVTPKRRELMCELLRELTHQEGDGRHEEALCPECGKPMQGIGRRKRRIVHAEGEVEVEGAYHHCPTCGTGLFPPGPPLAPGEAEPDTQDD